MSTDQRPPYDATAVRPSWDDLPAQVRAAIAGWTGEPVRVRSAGGGFTRGFAAALTDATGRSRFVKAVPAGIAHIAASYRREIEVHRVLPAGTPAPRLLHSGTVLDPAAGQEWTVLVLEHVAGHMPGVPWTATDLALVVRSLEQSAMALRGLDWHDDATILEFAEGEDLAAVWPRLDAAVLPADLAAWLPAHRSRLRATTEQAREVLRGEAWTHSDLRGDNIVIDGDRAWIVDWNWLCRAPEWSDLVLLLPLVHADGVDVTPACASWLLDGVPAADVDAAIAWLAALMLRLADAPVVPGGSVWIGPHRHWTASACLRFLRDRWA
mgnify:CR=1 FL=1